MFRMVQESVYSRTFELLIPDTPKPSICLQNSMNANLNCLGEYICKAGYRVGRQLVERYTADKPRLGETLDVIKFICKEFWNEVFHKQVALLQPSVSFGCAHLSTSVAFSRFPSIHPTSWKRRFMELSALLW